MDTAPDFRPVRFSTSDLPARDRVAAWREHFGPRVFGADIEPAADVPFRTDVTTRLLPGFRLVSTQGSPARYARTRPFLADGRDHFGLHLSLSDSTVSHRGREVACATGEAVPLSAAETGAVVSSSMVRFCHLWFPRAGLSSLVPGLEETALRRVPPESEALRYLIGYVRFLDGQKTFTDAKLIRAAASHVGDLFALLLGATGDAAALAEGRGLRAARLQAIKRYVASNLGHPGLTVAAAAACHRVAPRYVQRLFESEGTTFSEYVLNQRLARAYRLLGDPAYAGWTVTAIALEAGFSDVSYFNRRFRRRYGQRPTDVRAAAARDA